MGSTQRARVIQPGEEGWPGVGEDVPAERSQRGGVAAGEGEVTGGDRGGGLRGPWRSSAARPRSSFPLRAAEKD